MAVLNFVPRIKFVDHQINSSPPPPIAAIKYDYLFAGNGLFVRAKRREFSVCLPVAPLVVNDLPPAVPRIDWHRPRIPATLWREIIRDARSGCLAGEFREDLFAVFWSENSWRWERIGRDRSVASTIADDSRTAYRDACLEVHTHPAGALDFSVADDRDETGKFRIFGIIADIHSPNPLIRFRCGVHDYFFQIPALAIGEMPVGVLDLALLDGAERRFRK